MASWGLGFAAAFSTYAQRASLACYETQASLLPAGTGDHKTLPAYYLGFLYSTLSRGNALNTGGGQMGRHTLLSGTGVVYLTPQTLS